MSTKKRSAKGEVLVTELFDALAGAANALRQRLKATHSHETVGQFVRALNDLLRLQETVCGQGIGKTIVPKRILR